MATPTVDTLVAGNMVMHDHSESDLGVVLDPRYLKLTGGTVTGALVVENDTTFGKLGVSTYTEDFEGGTLGDFTTSGDVVWAVENTVVHGGTYAVKSGTIADGQSSSLQLITTIVANSLISFYYKSSTETWSDACRLTIDGVYVDTLTGTVDWTQKKYWLSAGTHTIIFKFARDVGGSAGTNSIYMDDFDISDYEYQSSVLGNLRVGSAPQTGISITEVDGFINTTKGYMINGAPTFNSVGWSYFAGYNAGGATLPGVMNTVIGYEAGLGSGVTGFIGNWSTLIGYQAGKACTTGYYNTFVGAWAGLTVTTGYNNTIFGEAGGGSLTEGYYNTFLGRLSGFKVVTGYRNTCVGAINLHGSATTAQIENVTFGYSAGRYVAGNYNTLLGSYAGDGITSGSSNIAIGYKAEVPTATASNQLSIGNLIYGTGIDGTDATISTGNLGIGVKAPGSRLVVKGTGATSATSSLNITDSADASKFFVRDDGNVGIGTTAPTAVLHLKAGTATANTAPLKFTTGTSLTTAEAGAVEFTTDDLFFTITTGAARKGFVLDDGARLTSGLIPVATTNGRLTNLTPQLYEADLKVDYVAGDLDTEAEVITALNATNTKINAIITKLETLGLFATS